MYCRYYSQAPVVALIYSAFGQIVLLLLMRYAGDDKTENLGIHTTIMLYCLFIGGGGSHAASLTNERDC